MNTVWLWMTGTNTAENVWFSSGQGHNSQRRIKLTKIAFYCVVCVQNETLMSFLTQLFVVQ